VGVPRGAGAVVGPGPDRVPAGRDPSGSESEEGAERHAWSSGARGPAREENGVAEPR
jgi:hypothetical protein